jgi:hypothetical protein
MAAFPLRSEQRSHTSIVKDPCSYGDDAEAGAFLAWSVHICHPRHLGWTPLPDSEGNDPCQARRDTSNTRNLDMTVRQLISLAARPEVMVGSYFMDIGVGDEKCDNGDRQNSEG